MATRTGLGGSMQVGDLVIYRDGTYGVIIEVDDCTAQVFCHWADGASSWALKWYVEAA